MLKFVTWYSILEGDQYTIWPIQQPSKAWRLRLWSLMILMLQAGKLLSVSSRSRGYLELSDKVCWQFDFSQCLVCFLLSARWEQVGMGQVCLDHPFPSALEGPSPHHFCRLRGFRAAAKGGSWNMLEHCVDMGGQWFRLGEAFNHEACRSENVLPTSPNIYQWSRQCSHQLDPIGAPVRALAMAMCLRSQAAKDTKKWERSERSERGEQRSHEDPWRGKSVKDSKAGSARAYPIVSKIIEVCLEDLCSMFWHFWQHPWGALATALGSRGMKVLMVDPRSATEPKQGHRKRGEVVKPARLQGLQRHQKLSTSLKPRRRLCWSCSDCMFGLLTQCLAGRWRWAWSSWFSPQNLLQLWRVLLW